MDCWVPEMQAKLDWWRYNGRRTREELSGSKKTSIYKVHPSISKINEEAFQPRVVSFGPYHHGKPNLASMEAHKERALVYCIGRSERSMQEVFDFVKQMAQELKDSYNSLDAEWQNDTDKFVQLMILDGCFMLELLHFAFRPKYCYLDIDPIFSRHGDLYVMLFIRADMLLLENQLPILLLLKLKGFLQYDEIFTRAFPLELLYSNSDKPGDSRLPDSEIATCLHVLDVYRKGLLHTNEHGEERSRRAILPPTDNRPRVAPLNNIVRSATELHEAGVRFKKSKSKSLRDITFKGGVLELPSFIVDNRTESTFLNLIAFERCHILAGNDIALFLAFMDRIIDDSRDIKLLSSKGIIENHIGSDKKAADLFNKMSNDVAFDLNSNLGQVYMNLINYSDRRWPKWRASLIHTYFKSPWAIISVFAAFILLSLTAVQTIFSILN